MQSRHTILSLTSTVIRGNQTHVRRISVLTCAYNTLKFLPASSLIRTVPVLSRSINFIGQSIGESSFTVSMNNFNKISPKILCDVLICDQIE